MKPKVGMVNENDELIGYKLYKDIDFPNEIYRVSRLWVTDPEGNILLQKRNPGMHFHPGLWACAAAGTNDEGETYEFNIIKEAKEEVGLDVVPHFLKKQLEQHSGRNVFSSYFSYKVNQVMPEIAFDPEEVADAKWYSPNELGAIIEAGEKIFTPDVVDMFSYF